MQVGPSSIDSDLYVTFWLSVGILNFLTCVIIFLSPTKQVLDWYLAGLSPSPIYSLRYHVPAAIIPHFWNSAKLQTKLVSCIRVYQRSEDNTFAKSQKQVQQTVLCSTSPTNKTVVAEPEGSTLLIPQPTQSVIFTNYPCHEVSVLGCDVVSLGIWFPMCQQSIVVLPLRVIQSQEPHEPQKWDQYAVPKHKKPNTQWHSITSWKNQHLIHIGARTKTSHYLPSVLRCFLSKRDAENQLLRLVFLKRTVKK
jgi:hypothetical protein